MCGDGSLDSADRRRAASTPRFTMKVVIFLGPSLPLEEARQILDAVYLPPAQQADIVSVVGMHRPDVIGLVDGEFGQSLSVWHKEILYALDRGIHVFGASSMGALRAAETDMFGMIGVGEVYRQFASGGAYRRRRSGARARPRRGGIPRALGADGEPARELPGRPRCGRHR